MARKPTRTSAKNRAWHYFSRWVRLVHADAHGYCRCITCEELKPWQEMQAGHFIGGRTNAVLFDERIVYPQCVRCNVFGGGEYVAYTIVMIKRYGIERVEEFKRLKWARVKYTTQDYLDIAERYKRLSEELERPLLEIAG